MINTIIPRSFFCFPSQILPFPLCNVRSVHNEYCSSRPDVIHNTVVQLKLSCRPNDYIYVYNQLFITHNDNIFTGQDPLWTTWIKADVYKHIWQNTNSCELVLEEVHYHIILTSQWCTFMDISSVYSRILILQWYQWGQSVPRLVCWTCIPVFYETPLWWHSGAKTCRSLILVMNCILLNITECIHWYIECKHFN